MSPQNPENNFPSGMESNTEKFPTVEELKSQLEHILQGKEYKELRIENDEQGVSLYEIEVTHENGSKTEYNFQKATYNYKDTSLPVSMQFSASLHSVQYDEDGMPTGGDTVANYLDGQWKYL